MRCVMRRTAFDRRFGLQVVQLARISLHELHDHARDTKTIHNTTRVCPIDIFLLVNRFPESAVLRARMRLCMPRNFSG